MIRIASKKDGFRRCGVAHPKAATDHPDSRFTKAQLEILQAEPLLVVQLVDDGSDSGKGNALNAKDTIALVQAVTTVEELEKFVEGEERKGVHEAIAKKGAELVAAAEKRRKELDEPDH